ncbi:MAG: hypothetical protein PHR06_07360 [Candidatus Cloacimonetes bacterium]|nr:hypothetical protein [Candidatus Cloacimonadota bacterium]
MDEGRELLWVRVTGQQVTTIENCSAIKGTGSGSVTGDAATGGLVGSNNSSLTNASNSLGHQPRILTSYAGIDVVSSNSGDNKIKFGGLTGCNQKGYIENCYATGSVSAAGYNRAGGLAGCIEFRGVIVNSYSTGTVSGAVGYVGGFVGYLGTGNNAGYANNCFWDKQTSGLATSAAGTGKTTTEMKLQATFTSWDFTNVWNIDSGVNNGYPYLRNNVTNNTQMPTAATYVFPSNVATGLPRTVTVNWRYTGDEEIIGFKIYQNNSLISDIQWTGSKLYYQQLNIADWGSTVNWKVAPYNGV